MHLLAAHYRSEFLATPSLVRLDYVQGKDGREPTLLIKASTLLLKYIVLKISMKLHFIQMGERLLYALEIRDDDLNPAITWSVLEREEERSAMIALSRGETCQIFLFNELAVNVAWAARSIEVGKPLENMASAAAVGFVDYEIIKEESSAIFDCIISGKALNYETIETIIPNTDEWNPVLNQLITNQAAESPINLFDQNEGGQQEQLALWLTDNLQPTGAHTSPQIPKGKGSRELTDVLLSYQFGSILIESKALAVLGRSILPTREKLARNMVDHITKAVDQLKGAVRQIKLGTPVATKTGTHIEVERTQPVHAIVLIPDFSLIKEKDTYDRKMMAAFNKETGGWIHILDVSELLRIVQAAEVISEGDKRTTPMMAFDYYLIERAKTAYRAGTLFVEILLKFSDK